MDLKDIADSSNQVGTLSFGMRYIIVTFCYNISNTNNLSFTIKKESFVPYLRLMIAKH